MKKLIYFISFLFLIVNVSALINIEIAIDKEFGLGETVNFDYTLVSDTDEVITYLPHSECPNAPVALLQKETIKLKAGVPYTNPYSDILIDDSVEPQTCIALVEIIEPVQQRIEKTFEIKTNPSFDFEILLNKKVFVKNEDVNIDYDSEVLNPKIEGILTYPNKKMGKVSLPHSFKADQIGTYELDVTANKEGYKIKTIKEQFGVIEKEAEIGYLRMGEVTRQKEEFKWWWFGGIFLIMGIFYLLYKRMKE